jgi:hypothetical protein
MEGDLDALAVLPSPEPQDCFACGRSFLHGALRADASGPSRFCSNCWRDAFDAGFPPYAETSRAPRITADFRVIAGPDILIVPDLPARGDGCLIRCLGCQREFVSRGLRCCSTECDRAHRERLEIEATVAEVGTEIVPKRKCEVCGAIIPRWTKGKATPKNKRFCSAKCAARARAHPEAIRPQTIATDTQKPLSNWPLERRGVWSSVGARRVGGCAGSRQAQRGALIPKRHR